MRQELKRQGQTQGSALLQRSLQLLLYYLFFLSLTFLSGSFFAGYCAAAAILMGVAIVNFYVMQFRGIPIVPWDFLSIRTAANVAGGFEYKIYWQMLLATFGFVFLILTTGKMKAKLRFLPVRIGGFLIAAAALVFVIHGLQDNQTKSFWGIDTTLFTPTVRYTKNGFWPAFLSNLSFLHIDKPSGYSVEEVEKIAETADEAYEPENRNSVSGPQTEAEEDTAASVQTPNIIVIMNEAFSDLSVLGDFNTNEDYMPNFRAMMDKLEIPMPEAGMATTVEEAIEIANKIGYPVMVRPSYVLGGRGM